MGRRSVWTGSDEFRIDLASLDELFGQKASQASAKGSKAFRIGSPQALTTCTSTLEKVSILQGKRSLNVGIFLRHFRSSVEEIIEDVRRGHGQRYGSEKLKELYKLLPDREEEKQLRTFQGHHTQLEQPDLFLFLLIGIPSFRLRLEAMILKADFDPALSSITNSARCLASAARELMNCAELHSILRLVLKAGNYINAGGYAGNAAGFHIVSLLKLAETKTNKPGMTLLHFVAMEAVKKDPCLLTFQHKISHVERASRLSEDVVKEDLSQLQKRITALQASSHAELDLQKQNKLFHQRAVGKLKEAEEEVKAMLSARQSLLDFFCENETTFKLEEACSIFHSFQMCFHRAVQENKMREQQEERQVEREQAERARAKARAAKRRSIASCTALEAEWSGDANELAASLETTLMKGLCHTFHRRTRATASSRPRPTLHSLMEQVLEDGEADPQHQHQLGGQRGRLVRSSRKLQATASLFPTDAQQSPWTGETSTQSSSSSQMEPSFTAIPRPRLLAQSAQSMEHVRPRVGETHTLVKGLCSYKSLTLPPPRTPPLSRYSHSQSQEKDEEEEEEEEEEMETEEAQVTQPTQSTGPASPAISRTQRASLPRRWRVAQGSNKTASLTSTPTSRLCSSQKTEPEERGRKANPLRRLLEKAKPDRERQSGKDQEQREKSKERELLDKADKQRVKKEKEEQKKNAKKEKKEKKEKEGKKDKERGRGGVTDDKTETQKESESAGDTEATAMECDYGSMAVSRLPSNAPLAVPVPVPHGHGLPRMLQSSVVTTARALRSAVITATAAAKRDRSRSSTPTPSPNPNKGLASRMLAPVPAQDVASQITRM